MSLCGGVFLWGFGVGALFLLYGFFLGDGRYVKKIHGEQGSPCNEVDEMGLYLEHMFQDCHAHGYAAV